MGASTAEVAALTDDATRELPDVAAIAVQAAVSAAYYEGLRDGVTRYAWWKDGTQYVGSGVYTLADALNTIDQAEQAGEWGPA